MSRIHLRGFGSMNKTRRRAIARQGGQRAHELLVAHRWTKEEASLAGRKGAASRRAKALKDEVS